MNECTQCGAQNMEPMGRLGRNVYYRCERCGWQDAVPVDDPQAAREAEEDEGPGNGNWPNDEWGELRAAEGGN